MILKGSGFSSLHPGLSFSYFVLCLLFAMVFQHPAYLLSILVCAILLNLLLDGGKGIKKSAKFYLFLAGVIILLNPFFSGRGATILFYFRDRPVTLESVTYGILLALSLLSILLVFQAYNRVITADRFLFLLSPLVPRTAFMITVTLRFIPLMKRRLQEITAVQQALGAFSLEKSKRKKAREAMETLNILLTWSLEASLQTAASMRARGYERGKRSSAVAYSLDKRDLFWMVFMAVTGLSALLGVFWGHGRFEIYPSLGEIGPVFNWHFTVLMIFLLFPIVIEGRELVFWRYIRSKM